MSLAQNTFKVNKFIIETLDGNKTIDLCASVGGNSSLLMLDYYENLLEPCIKMSILLGNSNSLTNILPIRGGEKVSLNITFSLEGDEFSFEGDRSLYVYRQGERMANTSSEYFTLDLVSREGLTNETNRCKKRYNGNIRDSVIRILKEDLLTTRYKEENIERTANNYSFIGTFKKPFTTLFWLGSKSLPTENSRKTKEVNKKGSSKGVAGFLFFENQDGFNFKSIESLVSKTNAGTADLKDIPHYFYDGLIETNKPENKYRIANYNVEKNSDIIRSLRGGMYSNVTYFYNLFTQRFSVYQYNLKDEIQNASRLGTNDQIAVSDSFGASPSRIYFRTSDIGVLDNALEGAVGYDESQQRDIADIAKSISRYNILFTQSLNIVVPCNIKLKVGDIISVDFPRIEKKDLRESDSEQSGLYLIYNLRHHVQYGKLATSLNLIRDSYGLYGSTNRI